MDLKDLVKQYIENGEEAYRALNAGHPETTEKLLRQNEELIRQYFKEKTTQAGNVTESATSETAAEIPEEKPEEVPGAPAQPGSMAAAAAALGSVNAQEPSKPTQ